ncbi:MAG: hypothetical protein IAB19_04535 [Proteobacteria bacterium]|uniref:DUF3298 domain-containing protein n=1 Tax=Candidatus Avisuccinivibrio stercorigallinarum TaxID=2840704 RepID=A0A9D9D9M5_9GAMM|nr:hypothetical protein [Candidatus Avisuccinivibrio stercorigallinarum]
MTNLKLTAAAAAAAALLSLPLQAQAFDLFGLFSSDDKDAIESVQQGVLPDYSTTVKVGAALEHYFDCKQGSAKWSSEVTAREETLVHYQCDLNQFSNELHDLGLMESLVTLRSGLEGFLAAPDKGTESFSKAKKLTEEAIQNLKSVNLKVSFVMSVTDEGAFEPRTVAVQPVFKQGEAKDFELRTSKLKLVFKDKSLFDQSDDDIIDFVTSLPQLYQAVLPQEAASGEAI